MESVVVSNPEILGGTPVFAGTRVPVKNLTDYLEGGATIEVFLDDFPSVKREQVVYFLGVMEKIKRGEERLRAEGGISQAEMERDFAKWILP